MIQVARDEDHVIDILTRKGVLEDLDDWELDLAKKRLKRAKNWVEKYAPDQSKLKVLEEIPSQAKEELSGEQAKCLASLADDISQDDYGPVEIHNRVYETAREYDIEPVDLFQAIYQVLLGRKSGPRVGNFLTALEDEFVIKRFRETKKE